MSQEKIRLDQLVQNLSSNSWNELLSACFNSGIDQNTVLNYMADRNSICELEASMDFEITSPDEISEALASDTLFSLQQTQTPDTASNDGLDDYFSTNYDDDNNGINDTFDFTFDETNQQTKQQDSQPNSNASEILSDNDIDMFLNDDCTCIFYPEINKQPTCDYCESVLIAKEKKEEDEKKILARKKEEVEEYANRIFSRPVRLQFFFDE